jgi:F-type H+-transporting ATPase subunit epsilon
VPLSVEVVSPERVLYSGEADMLVCRTSEGEIAFLPGHAPFLGALGIGVVRSLLPERGEQAVAVHGGFVEVSSDRVIVLSDVAELAEQIDVERARTTQRRKQRCCAPGPDSRSPGPSSARNGRLLRPAVAA